MTSMPSKPANSSGPIAIAPLEPSSGAVFPFTAQVKGHVPSELVAIVHATEVAPAGYEIPLSPPANMIISSLGNSPLVYWNARLPAGLGAPGVEVENADPVSRMTSDPFG